MRYIKYMKLLILVGLFISPLSQADTEVGLLLNSYHFDRSQEYNEKNYGVYGMHRNIFIMVYDNSYDDTATILGYQFNIYNGDRFDFNLNVGAVYGYGTPDDSIYGIGDAGKYGHDLIPVVVPNVTYQLTDNIKINTYLMGTAVAIGFGVEL